MQAINIKQEMVIDLIMAGYSDSEAAAEAGVARQTVSRWRNKDPDFIQALEVRRELMRQRHMEAFSQLVEKAMRVMDKALESRNEHIRLKAATFVLRVSGLEGYEKPEKKLSPAEQEKATFLSALEQALLEAQEERERRYLSGEV